nr:hypothetical protein [Verminephrobacter eiseniae]
MQDGLNGNRRGLPAMRQQLTDESDFLCGQRARPIPVSQGRTEALGAYDTKACHEAIAGRQAAAIIRTRRNAKPWADGKAGAQANRYLVALFKRLPLAQTADDYEALLPWNIELATA